jgi:hypothetical protein
VAEHSINLGHQIQLQNTTVLVKEKRQMDQILRQVTEIEVKPDNMDREDGFSLSQTWKPLIHDLREQRQYQAKVQPHPVGPGKG